MTKGQNKKTTTTTRFSGVGWLFLNLPFVCYLTVLTLGYIYNKHSIDRKKRRLEVLSNEVKDLYWQQMDIKQEIMYGSTQSQIEQKVADLELVPMRKAPLKLNNQIE